MMESSEVKKRLVEANDDLEKAKEFSRDMVRALASIVDLGDSMDTEQRESWNKFMGACTGHIMALTFVIDTQKGLIEELITEMFPDEDWVVEKG